MSLLDDVTRLREEASKLIDSAETVEALGDLQITYLGRKGAVTAILKGLKDLPVDERKEAGAQANKTRAFLEGKIKAAREKLSVPQARSVFDPTLPGTGNRVGVRLRPERIVSWDHGKLPPGSYPTG